VTWQKVPTRALCSLTPTCISRRTGGGIQMGVGDGRCRCPKDIGVGEDHSRNKRPSVHLAAGATGAAIRAGRHANSGHGSCRRRLRSLVDCVQRRGHGGALGYSLDIPPAVSMPKALQTAFAGGAASAAGGGLTRGVVLILPSKAPFPKQAAMAGRPL